jgi:DNA-binding MurR/RpiR family transcriptional regulator
MSFKQAIEQYKGRLTGADERLIRELIASPTDAPFLSAAELSRRANVHEASAVRLAQKLGYRGYPELRAALRTDLLGDTSPAERVRRRLAGIETDSLLVSLVNDEIAAMQELTTTISQEQLDDVARQMCAARRIFLFGRGNATILVELMDRRLRRSGFDTVDLRSHGRDLAERLLTLSQDDLLLAFAFHSRLRVVETLLTVASDVGAQSVLISDDLALYYSSTANTVLSARRGAEGEFQTLTVPMAICNALLLTITRFDGGRTFETLSRLTEVADQFSDEKERGS